MGTKFPYIEVASLGSKTRKSRRNEDAIAYCVLDSREEQDIGQVAAICIADGMTTLASPHYASSCAIKTAMGVFLSTQLQPNERPSQMLVEANDALLNHPSKQNFGTTLTAVVVSDKTLHIANIGDGRIYQITNSKIRCLTQDHSRLSKHLGRNPNKAEVKASQMSKKLERSLGEKSFGADYCFKDNYSARCGDVFIICTDGLWTEFDDDELLSLTNKNITALGFAELAMERDNTDDISVALLRF